MKKGFALLCSIALLLGCAACAGAEAEGGLKKPKEEQTAPAALPGAASPENPGEEAPPEQADGEGAKKTGLYEPGIFVLEASGSWRQELAPGYFVDYECELYLDKTDANDSRSASGLYTGVFWMKTSVSAEDYLKDLLKDVPVQMDFMAGGEGVCDNLTMHLLDGYERDPFKSIRPGPGAASEMKSLAEINHF